MQNKYSIFDDSRFGQISVQSRQQRQQNNVQGLYSSVFIASLSNSRRQSANVDVIADVKSKIIVLRRHFFADLIFSATSQKFKTIKIKPEKIPLYTQTNTCLLHISRNFKDIFKYICFMLYL